MMEKEAASSRVTIAAVVAGVAGVAAAFVLYWMVVPGVVLGLTAVALGAKSRRQGRKEVGSVAITLGIVAMLAVPAFLSTADVAEDWGRDCALDPSHDPNC
jgi:hypothetical protein